MLLAAAAGAASILLHGDHMERVRERGAEVMPFSLDKTLHSFVKAPDGGVQSVLARDTTDVEQVELIRVHLREITKEFEQGRFTYPVAIHGEEMAGVNTLSENPPEVQCRVHDAAGRGVAHLPLRLP